MVQGMEYLPYKAEGPGAVQPAEKKFLGRTGSRLKRGHKKEGDRLCSRVCCD